MNTATFTQQDIINAQTSAKIDILAQEMKDFKEEMREFKGEMRDFKEEMRQQNEMRHAEITEIRQSIDSTNKYIRNFFYTSLAAIGAMLLTVLLNSPK